MERLRRVFLGHGRSKAIAASRYANSIVAEEEAGGDGQREKSSRSEAEKRGLADFENHMAQLVKDAHDTPGNVRTLLVLTLEVGMWMRIYRLNDPTGAHEFLHSWFSDACRLAKPDPDKLFIIRAARHHKRGDPLRAGGRYGSRGPGGCGAAW